MGIHTHDLLNSLNKWNRDDSQLGITHESHPSISKEIIVEYTKDYLHYDKTLNRFTHRISALNMKYDIPIKNGVSFFNKFSIFFHVSTSCKFCGVSKHNLSIPSRTDLIKIIKYPTASLPVTCSICSHKSAITDHKTCHCSGCKEELQRKIINNRKISFQKFNLWREKIDSTEAPLHTDLADNLDKLNLLNTWTKFSSGNISKISEALIANLLKLGFLKLRELSFEEFIQKKLYIFIEDRTSLSANCDISNKIIDLLEINERNVSFFINDFISELTRENSPFTNQIHNTLAPENRIIREFTIAIAQRHGLNLVDLTDKTVNNLVQLIDIMSIHEALAAIRTSLRSATGWCAEKSVTGIHKRNIALSFLNQLYHKYRFEGWQKPVRPLEDWELEEDYGISTSLYSEFTPILQKLKSMDELTLQQEFYNCIYRL